MGRLITWETDVVPRYNTIADIGSGTSVDDAFVVYAENAIEQRLSGCFTLPFSSNNVTVKDLMIDETFRRTQVYKDSEKAKEISDDLDMKIERLCSGEDVMLTTSGDIIEGGSAFGGGAIASTTENYTPTFSMLDETLAVVDPDQIDDEIDKRYP